ncbi:MAG: RNA polymerase sigma factor [Thermoanaerobaculia bacterium]
MPSPRQRTGHEGRRAFARRGQAEAARVLADPADAEEVAQEILCKVWRHACHYDPRRARVATWLRVMTRRCAIDRLRQRRRWLRFLAEQPRALPATPPEVLDRELLHSRILRTRRAFRELPPEQRRVVALALLRDMTQRAIAEATGTPLGTVKTRALAAKRRLRRALA